MVKKEVQALAEILRRNVLAAASADRFRAHGDVHQALIRQVALDVSRYCATRSAAFREEGFLAACGLGDRSSVDGATAPG